MFLASLFPAWERTEVLERWKFPLFGFGMDSLKTRRSDLLAIGLQEINISASCCGKWAELEINSGVVRGIGERLVHVNSSVDWSCISESRRSGGGSRYGLRPDAAPRRPSQWMSTQNGGATKLSTSHTRQLWSGNDAVKKRKGNNKWNIEGKWSGCGAPWMENPKGKGWIKQNGGGHVTRKQLMCLFRG